MEWKTKPDPKPGQYRERIIFAWLPRRCEDGITRWLCNVRILEFFNGAVWDGFSSTHPQWREEKCYRAEVEV